MKNIKSLFIFLLFIGGFSACSPMISSKVVPTVKVCLNKNPLNGNQLADEIIKLNIKNPNILVWFSGEQGLTKRSYDFYQQELFTGCAQQLKNNYQPYLYTLGGWSRLKDAKTVIDDSHINAIAAKNLCTSYISSNVFFESLSKTTAQDTVIFEDILKRKFIWELSEKFQPNKVTLGDFFMKSYGNIPSYIKMVAKIDTATSYSALQYLEGLWLVREITRQASKFEQSDIDIIFWLPFSGKTPEYQYYCTANGDLSPFAEDVTKLLANDTMNKIKNITIWFNGFDYEVKYKGLNAYGKQGNLKCFRPYLYIANATEPKNNDIVLTKDDIK